jgi:hypothetical protein
MFASALNKEGYGHGTLHFPYMIGTIGRTEFVIWLLRSLAGRTYVVISAIVVIINGCAGAGSFTDINSGKRANRQNLGAGSRPQGCE